MNDYVTCPRCGGNYDFGELKGGICDDCREEEARRERETDFYACLSEQSDGQVTFLRLTPQYTRRVDTGMHKKDRPWQGGQRGITRTR